jgi:quinol monooxygenase YgiN
MSSNKLAHMVFFTLHDNSESKVNELISACHQYLNNHPGVIYFSVGKPTPDLVRPVNDRAHEVALHVVFADRAAHDAYQVAPRHQEFIDLHKANWKQVRVFDADIVNA